jgi:hypothetical protein
VARPAKAAPRTAPPAWAPPLKASPVAGPPVSVGAVRAQLGQRGLGAQAGQYDLEYQPVVLDANGNPVAAAALTDAQGNPQLGATGKPVIRFSDLGLQNSDAALSAFAQAVINGQQAANRDDSPCPGHSFSGATRVLMGDGSTEPIAAVKAGDLIENARPGGGTEVHRVDQVHVTTTDTDFTDVVVEAGGAGGTVTGTWNHPYYDASAAAFVPAGALHAGEHLQSSTGAPATVAEVRPHFGPMVTFDLTVDGLHTYFVLAGRTPVLVHNCATTIAIADRLKSQVDLLHKLLPPSAQNRRSTAVIQAVDGNGNLHNVVGWSGARTLDPLIRNALGDGEVMADRMAGDAEVSALNTIKDRGWTPIAGAANRPVCPWCQNTLFDDFSPTVGPARLVGPATPTRINGIRSTPGGTPLLGQSEFVWD